MQQHNFSRFSTMAPFFIGKMTETRFLLECKRTDTLMRPDVDPACADLWQKLLEVVLFQIRALNEKFANARIKKYNAILYGFHALIVSVSSLDMSTARTHLKGAFAYIDYMGGLDVLTNPHYKENACCWLLR